MSLALDPAPARVPPAPPRRAPAAAGRRPRPPAPVPLAEVPGTLALLKGLRDNPVATWTRWHFEQPIVHGRNVLGSAAVVSDPAIIRHVLVGNAANYDKGELQRRTLGGGLGTGLLLAEGEQWRAQRRALAPLFSPRHVEGFKRSMVEVADEMVGRWSSLRDGRRIDVANEMARATLRVLGRTVFSEAMSGPEDRFAHAVSAFLEAAGQLDPLDVLGMPSWVPRLAANRTRPLLRYFEEEVSAILEKRRALLASGAPAPQDILSLLLAARDPETGVGLSDDDVRANVVTFLIAGHETTSNTLTWALYLLSQHPEEREAVEREVDALMPDGRVDPTRVDDFVRTRAALEEAMRLYPPAASITREALGPDMLGTLRIKARTLVVVSPYVLHRHRTLWDAPDHFHPERFLPENRGRIDRFAFLPFGAGPRVCIAASFALQEAVILLATALRHVRFDHAPGHAVMPVQRITLRSRGGMPMMLRHR
ncbi:cytochrome P450 [Lichenibacterium dinghuense]|uniref:cytochrome P450 n=1 Tax=Lichenibacterium dinghuense TaxID=2895977 RepID=UPI001F39F2DB|nr:cytochrome P450 [Lichenibacterium sp. 6Y81]